MAKNKNYRVRDHHHHIEGEFSEMEILKRIAEGKYTGEEEISAGRTERWQKLSSHPVFYDAFIKRLYEKEYSPPDASRESSRSKSLREKGTRKETQLHTSGSEGGGQSTRHLTEERGKDLGATLQQSVIDELFSESVSRPEIPSPPPHEIGTEVIHFEGPHPGGKFSELTRPLDVAAGIAEEESPEVVALRKRKERRRIIVWGCALTLCLVLLFEMGKKDAAEEGEDIQSESAALQSEVRQLIATTPSRDEKLRALTEEGQRLYEHDSPPFYAGAQEVYREGLSYDESSANLLGRLSETAARTLSEATRPEATIREIKQLISRGRASDPQLGQFYRTESIVAIFQEKQEEAKNFILNALEADPANPENSLVMGEVFYALGDLNSARLAFEESVKGNPYSVRAHYLLARVSLAQKDLTLAKKEAYEALKLNPIHPYSYFVLAEVLAQQNELNEAKQYFETAGRLVRLGSKSLASQAFFKLGLLQVGSESEKSFQLSYYYSSDPSKELREKVRKLDTSKKTLRKLAEEYEFAKSYFQDQADTLIAEGKHREAIIFLQAVYLLDPRDGMALVRLGEAQEKSASSYEDFRAVTSIYQRAIQKNPALMQAYIRLGMLETEQYNFDRGYKLLTQALALAPEEAEPHVAMGKHFYKRQDYNEALNHFLQAAKLNPNDSEILYYAGLLRLLFKKEGMKEAVSFFYRAYTVDPQNYDALVEWLKLKVVNYEKNFAVKFAKNLLDQEPKSAPLHWVLGEVYASNKEYRRAITYYHQSLDIDNRSSRVRMSLARSLEAIGELDKAVAEYRLASHLDRRNSDGFFRAADLLFQMKNYNQAEEVLKILVNVTPNYPGAHRYLSKIYQQKNERDLAISAMQKEVANNPEHAKFRVELAELYMEYEKFDQAIAELTEVTNLPSLTKAPEYVYDKIRAYLLLSRSFRALSKFDSAEGAIKLALEVDPNDPELHRELGYVYYSLQRDKEGVKEFQFYLNRNPAAQDADEIRELIKKMVIEE